MPYAIFAFVVDLSYVYAYGRWCVFELGQGGFFVSAAYFFCMGLVYRYVRRNCLRALFYVVPSYPFYRVSEEYLASVGDGRCYDGSYLDAVAGLCVEVVDTLNSVVGVVYYVFRAVYCAIFSGFAVGVIVASVSRLCVFKVRYPGEARRIKVVPCPARVPYDCEVCLFRGV